MPDGQSPAIPVAVPNHETHQRVDPTSPPTRSLLLRVSAKYHFFEKVFTIFFAFLVFTIVARNIKLHRDLLSFMGIVLMITMVYIEVLIIRDHLWLLEGSIPEARRWRDVFFSRQTLSQQRWRKILVVLFAAIVFTYVYVRLQSSEIYTFLGVILMVTVLYFEVLTIRDEVNVLSVSVRARIIEETVRGEKLRSVPADTDPEGFVPKDDE